VIPSLHTSVFNQPGSMRTLRKREREREREGAIRIDVILLRLVTASRSFFLSLVLFFLASTYATDGRAVKGKKRRQTRTLVKHKKEREKERQTQRKKE
jgi:hypothetical protein